MTAQYDDLPMTALVRVADPMLDGGFVIITKRELERSLDNAYADVMVEAPSIIWNPDKK